MNYPMDICASNIMKSIFLNSSAHTPSVIKYTAYGTYILICSSRQYKIKSPCSSPYIDGVINDKYI